MWRKYPNHLLELLIGDLECEIQEILAECIAGRKGTAELRATREGLLNVAYVCRRDCSGSLSGTHRVVEPIGRGCHRNRSRFGNDAERPPMATNEQAITCVLRCS